MDRLIFMKAGPHGRENLARIIERKLREKNDAGSIWWGYGGVHLHPNRVRAFARLAADGKIPVLMSETKSDPGNEDSRVTQYSMNPHSGWQSVPSGIKVTGSKFALIFDTLELVELDLDLGHYDIFRMSHEHDRRLANTYFRGHVDKGCLIKSASPSTPEKKKIVLRAILKSPYAIYLR